MKMRISYEKRKRLNGYLFTAPFAVGTVVFFLYPLIMSIVLAFTNFKGAAEFNNLVWVGVENFRSIFVTDVHFIPNFKDSVVDTLINTPLIILVSLILAICINKKIRARGIFRLIFFLPFVLGSGMIYQTLMYTQSASKDFVMLNGISVPELFSKYFGPSMMNLITAFLQRSTTVFWKSGLQILLFLSALQSVSPSIYEAAYCDGASEWKNFWFITLPMLTPTILVNTIYTMIDSFSDINNTMMTYFNKVAFDQNNKSYASAMIWIYLAFIMVVVLIVTVIINRFVFYNTSKGGRAK